MAKRQPETKQPLTWQQRLLKEIREYVQIIAILLVITTFLFTTTGVAGSSMAPSLDGGVASIRSAVDYVRAIAFGDRLFIPKYETWLRRMGVLPSYERGDIIIFREHADSPCRTTPLPALLIKRVIGLPGDSLRIEQGTVIINDTPLDESFIVERGGSLGSANFAERRIPEGEYFVLGDNRTGSCDSRIYGTIPFRQITGRATTVIWPPMRDGELNWRVLQRPETYAQVE
jgi:signal peptidase I